MELIYYGPLFRSRTRKVLYGQILKGDWVPLTNKMSGKIDKRPHRNFSQAINPHTAREIPYSPGKFYTSTGCPAPMFAESVYRVNTTNKLKQCGSRKALQRDY